MDDVKLEAITQAKTTYNSDADYFDALSFWEVFGSRTIEHLELKPGQKVLDVCCGSGSSAIPAAIAVGSSGTVVAIDIAAELLKLGQDKANDKGLSQLAFREGNLENLGLPDEYFDAIICVFGIFFLPDMNAALKELGRMLRPGGKIAITSWGKSIFEPANQCFGNKIQTERPDLYSPWDSINDPMSLKTLIESATSGVTVRVFQETYQHPTSQPEDWWTICLGGGYQGIDQLDITTKEKVQSMNSKYVEETNVRELHTEVLYAIGKKCLM